MKRFSTGCGVFLLLLMAFVCYRVLTMPAIQPRLADLPAAEQKRRRVDAQRLVQEVENVARKVKRQEKGAWTVTATGEQLNTLLQDRIKVEGTPIKDIGIAIEPDLLLITGTTKYKGFNVPLALSGTLETPKGGFNFVANSLTLGGIPIGGNWKERAQTALTKGLKEALGKSNARFDKVTLEKDKLTLQGHTQS